MKHLDDEHICYKIDAFDSLDIEFLHEKRFKDELEACLVLAKEEEDDEGAQAVVASVKANIHNMI